MSNADKPIRVLVAGLGNMGRSHALAYHRNPGFEIVGLVNRSPVDLSEELKSYEIAADFISALKATKPDLASINTYSETHADYAIAAMEAGCHVFIEKPLEQHWPMRNGLLPRRMKQTAKSLSATSYATIRPGRRSLKKHESWVAPMSSGLNLNQQSSGPTWETHKSLMQTTSPIVDCGVHYVDVMCQITDAKPVSVNGMGLRLSQEIADEMYNYGHFQVTFEDGSVGWYEAGWGPMMSEQAFFVKDIISPNGSASIVVRDGTKSDDVDAHHALQPFVFITRPQTMQASSSMRMLICPWLTSQTIKAFANANKRMCYAPFARISI